jgi:toxin-antitoxin system, toxin component, Txe/YoeB family
MDRYFFLHTRSLSGIDYETYKLGLMSLNSVAVEMAGEEKRKKYPAVYNDPLYTQLCGDNVETSGLIAFIEQCSSYDLDIDSDIMFETEFPLRNVGFMGINFSAITGIEPLRQVIDSASFNRCRKCFYDRLIIQGHDRDLSEVLYLRFPSFSFSKEAKEDLLWWKHNRIEILDSVINLLDDIPVNPFTGGKGKTEVLSNTKTTISSKRITHEDRLTYTFGSITTIHRCKEHY